MITSKMIIGFDKRRGIQLLGQSVFHAVILPLRLNDYHDDGLYRESSGVIRDADSSRAALPLKTNTMGVPKKSKFSRILFSRYRSYEKCNNLLSLTKKMNVGGATEPWVA
jgi:hypothetical protein